MDARTRTGARDKPHAASAAILFDRDGTLIVDPEGDHDPGHLRPVRGARRALLAARVAGAAIGIVTNQPDLARGRVTAAGVDALHARLESEVGVRFDVVRCCGHLPDAGCLCRKPAPGLVVAACAELGLPPARVVVVGDIGSDVEAARRAGAHSVLVPTPVTRAEEIAAAPVVAPHLEAAVAAALRILARPHRGAAPGA